MTLIRTQHFLQLCQLFWLLNALLLRERHYLQRFRSFHRHGKIRRRYVPLQCERLLLRFRPFPHRVLPVRVLPRSLPTLLVPDIPLVLIASLRAALLPPSPVFLVFGLFPGFGVLLQLQ